MPPRKRFSMMKRADRMPKTEEEVPIATKKKEKSKHVDVKMYVDAAVDTDEIPEVGAAVRFVISMRFFSAVWGIIGDCDEVYNYWEPLHMFMYGKGFQTWEYSPVYAIRSYFYILIHYLAAYPIFSIFAEYKMLLFYAIRSLLGIFCLCGELYLYRAIGRKINNNSAQNFFILSTFSAGMFVAGTSFLPSSFAMTLNFYFIGAYLNEQWFIAILCTVLSAFVGWPFAAVLGLPIVVDFFLIRRQYISFIFKSIACATVVGYAMLTVDSHYFGKYVFAPLNIMIYNVLSGPGPELYGIEPMSYYFKNLMLNMNVAYVFAVLSLPLSMYTYMLFIPLKGQPMRFGIPHNFDYWRRYAPFFLIFFTALTWTAIFFTQPHKEERFIFPIYPHILFCAAVGLDAAARLIFKFFENYDFYFFFFIIGYIALNASRAFALSKHYGAHIDIYRALPETIMADESNFKIMHDPVRICLGKEWHRFPSNFFIPNEVYDVKGKPRGVEVQFIRSEFRGILPKHYYNGSTTVEITMHVPDAMNDRNREEPSRYVDLESCDFLIDVDMPGTPYEPNFREMPQWKAMHELPFLVNRESHPIFRAFNIPYIGDRFTYWTNYTIYRRIY
ncbi:unnamed protein product [Caenorhabditis bovis]|uniref:Mannosyltransferase n=1 Tax=Caenorhabditis bovis TaxID=2654633 RepID=A0A8S1FDH6_9PELO|nr:unnamed protein product [Caenorhabditis bovis]